jgi:hypothetical protein
VAAPPAKTALRLYSPAADRAGARHAACAFHLQAFFYFVTYDESARSRFFNDLGWVNHARRSDWGNALQRGFADFVSSWHLCVQAIGAEENFKIAIRRDPSGADLCSFALEWNKSLRSIGFLGDRARAQMHFDHLPALEFQQIGAKRRMRLQVQLDPKGDRLFPPIDGLPGMGPPPLPAVP